MFIDGGKEERGWEEGKREEGKERQVRPKGDDSFFLINFYWSIVALQCVSFYCTARRIHYIYIYTHTHTHTHTYICVYIYICVCVYISSIF